eukprot:TRINITY_DN6620_c0_g1_i13.p1 TRINITY_DN6620_c0_g1~~TRINITY_DN6620_c0_g1_i13.p1  ORF type:complete len:150 (+),score=20.13 TRINITY_DN6620_c0_g1_i13:782-1231(+)
MIISWSFESFSLFLQSNFIHYISLTCIASPTLPIENMSTTTTKNRGNANHNPNQHMNQSSIRPKTPPKSGAYSPRNTTKSPLSNSPPHSTPKVQAIKSPDQTTGHPNATPPRKTQESSSMLAKKPKIPTSTINSPKSVLADNGPRPKYS